MYISSFSFIAPLFINSMEQNATAPSREETLSFSPEFDKIEWVKNRSVILHFKITLNGVPVVQRKRAIMLGLLNSERNEIALGSLLEYKNIDYSKQITDQSGMLSLAVTLNEVSRKLDKRGVRLLASMNTENGTVSCESPLFKVLSKKRRAHESEPPETTPKRTRGPAQKAIKVEETDRMSVLLEKIVEKQQKFGEMLNVLKRDIEVIKMGYFETPVLLASDEQ